MISIGLIAGWLSIPVAAVVAIVMLAYWLVIGSSDVPPSRRQIRRGSIAVMLFLLPLIVAGVSFVDPARRQVAFVAIWCVVFLGVLVIVMFALLDVRNSLHLHTQHHKEMIVRAATELAQRREAERLTQEEDADSSEEDAGA